MLHLAVPRVLTSDWLEALWPEDLKKAGRCTVLQDLIPQPLNCTLSAFHCELRVLTAQ